MSAPTLVSNMYWRFLRFMRFMFQPAMRSHGDVLPSSAKSLQSTPLNAFCNLGKSLMRAWIHALIKACVARNDAQSVTPNVPRNDAPNVTQSVTRSVT
jgi:hypothetical protein